MSAMDGRLREREVVAQERIAAALLSIATSLRNEACRKPPRPPMFPRRRP